MRGEEKSTRRKVKWGKRELEDGEENGDGQRIKEL